MEQRISNLRRGLSSRRSRVKQLEASLASAESKVFPVPAPELKSLCDITQKSREDCETVLRRLRPRPSRLDLAAGILMGRSATASGSQPFLDGDDIGRLRHELGLEQAGVKAESKRVVNAIAAIEKAAAEEARAEAGRGPRVSFGEVESWLDP